MRSFFGIDRPRPVADRYESAQSIHGFRPGESARDHFAVLLSADDVAPVRLFVLVSFYRPFYGTFDRSQFTAPFSRSDGERNGHDDPGWRNDGNDFSGTGFKCTGDERSDDGSYKFGCGADERRHNQVIPASWFLSLAPVI